MTAPNFAPGIGAGENTKNQYETFNLPKIKEQLGETAVEATVEQAVEKPNEISNTAWTYYKYIKGYELNESEQATADFINTSTHLKESILKELGDPETATILAHLNSR